MSQPDLQFRATGAEKPELVVVLCHGFGAPATDLVGLGPELAAASPEVERRVRFVFPEAPLDLGEMGYGAARAWWMIDVNRFAAVAQVGGKAALEGLRQERSAGMLAAADRLQRLVEGIAAQYGLPLSRVVLGGFSQGAMVATEVALSLPSSVAALVAFSGTLLSESHWRKAAPRLEGLPALVTHGREDPILPYANAEALRDLLTEAGWSVEFVPFRGGHTIPIEGLRAFVGLLHRLLA